MGFISGWLMTAAFIFVFEIILLIAGKIIGKIFGFMFLEETGFSKIRAALCFSLAAGFIVSVI